MTEISNLHPVHRTTTSERRDLALIAGMAELMVSQMTDANDGNRKEPLAEETISAWIDATAFLEKSIRIVIRDLERMEKRLTGQPAERPIGGFDYWKGRVRP